MKAPIIGIVRGDPKEPGIYGIVNRAIMHAEKGWATHVRASLPSPLTQEWSTFDETLYFEKGKLFPFSGVEQEKGITPADLYRVPVIDFTAQELADLWYYFQVQKWIGRGYNIPQLLADAIIIKTRPFWEWLNVIPFAAHHVSAVCSACIGEGLVGVGHDYFDIDQAILAPQDFVTTKGLQDTVLT